jgi:two-component system NarL family sensor kinase
MLGFLQISPDINLSRASSRVQLTRVLGQFARGCPTGDARHDNGPLSLSTRKETGVSMTTIPSQPLGQQAKLDGGAPQTAPERNGSLPRATAPDRGKLKGRPRLIATVTSPIALFAVTGLVAAAVLGAIGVVVTRHAAVKESLRDARNLTRVLGATLRPRLNDALLAGDPNAIARLDSDVRQRGLVDPVFRIKVWSPQGRILYSDEPRLVGAVYPLATDDLEALYSGQISVTVSDLRRPENRFERGFGRVLEAYMPIVTSSRHRMLFETYIRASAVTANGEQLFLAFSPPMLAGLGLLWLIQLPLAWSLARRLRRHQERDEQLLLRALNASDEERRRIAADLHDTVVQELLGVSYSLLAASERADTATPSETKGAFRSAAGQLRENMRHLRTLLVEIYPTSARSAGLAAALEQIVISAREASDIRTDLTVDSSLSLDHDQEELVYRATQEALRNVNAHAHAGRVDVSLARSGQVAVLTVADDGVGFDPETVARQREENHFGLELLADRARRLRGVLSTISSPGEGTTVRLELPLP